MPTRLRPSIRGTLQLDRLTAQQRLFVKYCIESPNFDTKLAADQAGYKNPKSSSVNLLKNKIVAKAIAHEIHKRCAVCEFTAQQIIDRLRDVLNFDPTELYDEEGYISMETVKSLPEHQRRLITNIKAVPKREMNAEGELEVVHYIEVNFQSKDVALNLAMRHFGLMEPEVQVNVLATEIKANVLIELMQDVEKQSNVLDAAAIRKIAGSVPIHTANNGKNGTGNGKA